MNVIIKFLFCKFLKIFKIEDIFSTTQNYGATSVECLSRLDIEDRPGTG